MPSLRFGSHSSRKERKEEREAKKAAKKEAKAITGLPPLMPPCVMKSAENRNSVASNNSAGGQQPRTVLFRDNKLPDGTAMPRIQSQMVERRGAGGGRVSPTWSIRSSSSVPPTYPGLSSYPASYIPAAGTPVPQDGPLGRQRIHSDGGAYKSTGPVYDVPLPKPDYPLSNDGTGHSNRDSGLDSDSRSSPNDFKSGFTVYTNAGRGSRAINNTKNYNATYNGKSSLRQRTCVASLPLDGPQIIRPRGFQHPNAKTSSNKGLQSRYYNSVGHVDGGNLSRQRCWNEMENEEAEEDTYWSKQPTGRRQPHCSSCSCCDDDRRMTTAGSTNSLRRFQLEENPVVRRNLWTAISKEIDETPRQGRRRFRREGEEDDDSDVGRFQSLPSRGRFFSVGGDGSIERYKHPSPIRKPLSAKILYQKEKEEEEEEEEEAKMRTSDYQDDDDERSHSPLLVRRPRDFCRQHAPSADRSTIRL